MREFLYGTTTKPLISLKFRPPIAQFLLAVVHLAGLCHENVTVEVVMCKPVCVGRRTCSSDLLTSYREGVVVLQIICPAIDFKSYLCFASKPYAYCGLHWCSLNTDLAYEYYQVHMPPQHGFGAVIRLLYDDVKLPLCALALYASIHLLKQVYKVSLSSKGAQCELQSPHCPLANDKACWL